MTSIHLVAQSVKFIAAGCAVLDTVLQTYRVRRIPAAQLLKVLESTELKVLSVYGFS